jgi:hypothetical protein
MPNLQVGGGFFQKTIYAENATIEQKLETLRILFKVGNYTILPVLE